MYQVKIRQAVRLVVLLSIAGLTLLPTLLHGRSITQMVQCCRLSATAYRRRNQIGVSCLRAWREIYRWNGTSWDFVAPVASLFAEENYRK